MADNKNPTPAESLRWLVLSRNKIQRLMLRLHEHPNEPDGRQWQLYVGAAFSLWRAVFLCHDATEFNSRKLEPDVKRFLLKVIKTNAIGFTDDMQSSAWTGGYYINNALFRLDMRTVARPPHKTQRRLWEEAYAELNRRVPNLKDS